MIKKIIHTSDIHIRNYSRMEEYNEQLTKFIEKCRDIASKYDKEEVRIVISGDLLHQKNVISSELISFTSSFIRELEKIATVIVIAGNHDLIEGNKTRKDALSGIFETAQFSNTHFLDYDLDYSSGYVIDDNITWAVYSIYQNYAKPNINLARLEYENNKVVGLYHGMIIGSTMQNGSVVDSGLDSDTFSGCDCVMAGHIHKRQEMRRNDVPIVYSSSLIQQEYGETVTQHGFVVWDVDTMSYEFVDLESEYNLYDMEISSIDDIDNDKELLKNY